MTAMAEDLAGGDLIRMERVNKFFGRVQALDEVERPTPHAGEALVRIAAAGVNFMDVGGRRDVWLEKTL